MDSLETKLKRNKSLTSNRLKSVLLNLFDKKESLEVDKNATNRTDLMETFSKDS